MDQKDMSTLVQNSFKTVNDSFALHERIGKLVRPVFINLTRSVKPEYYEFIYRECIQDLYLYIISHYKDPHTNLNSFIRKRFEFLFLNACIKYRMKDPRLEFVDWNSVDNFHGEGKKEFIEEDVDYLINLMKNNKDTFSYTEIAIVKFYALGYNLNEISKMLNWSFGKTNSRLNYIITKLRFIEFKL